MFSQPNIRCLHLCQINCIQFHILPIRVHLQQLDLYYTYMQGKEPYEIKQIDKNNRGLFAKSTFKPWSIILECEPICISISISQRKRFCSYCALEANVQRCSQCKVLYYCSRQCQKHDWNHHKLECKSLANIADNKAIFQNLTMQILLNIRMWFLRKKSQQTNKRIQQMCCLIQFQTPQKLTQFQQTAVALCSILQIQRNQENISQLVKQQSTVSLNCFTIQDYLCSQDSVGLGIYWPANFINHHCHPNTIQIFDGRNLKIVANRPIDSGEEITISYMPVLDSWNNKQKLCRQGYLFECFCQECQVNKMFDQNFIYLKCPFCQSNSIKKKKKKNQPNSDDDQKQQEQGNRNIQFQHYCEKCKKQLSSTDINKVIDSANKQLLIIESKQADYQSLKKSLINFRKLVSMNDPRMKKIIERVYEAGLAESQKNQKIFEQCYILLKQMLEHVPIWYRLNKEDQIPYMFVWRYAELGKLAYNLQKLKKACQYTEKAYQIIKKVQFRNNFVEVKQLNQRYEEMKIGLSFNKAQIFKKR